MSGWCWSTVKESINFFPVKVFFCQQIVNPKRLLQGLGDLKKLVIALNKLLLLLPRMQHYLL